MPKTKTGIRSTQLDFKRSGFVDEKIQQICQAQCKRTVVEGEQMCFQRLHARDDERMESPDGEVDPPSGNGWMENWNSDAIHTVIENGARNVNKEFTSVQDDLMRIKDENLRLKFALVEASEANAKWKSYHEQKQSYIQRLVATIHELQHSNNNQFTVQDDNNVTAIQEVESQRLKEALTKLQEEHREHVQLLQMQVRAHRDDWEAERSEKRTAQSNLAETEARAALLLHQLQIEQAKLSESENRRGLCWRCQQSRSDASRTSSDVSRMCSDASRNCSPASSASQSTHVSPVPLVAIGLQKRLSIDEEMAPLKGWIPASNFGQISANTVCLTSVSPSLNLMNQSSTKQNYKKIQSENSRRSKSPAREVTENTTNGFSSESNDHASMTGQMLNTNVETNNDAILSSDCQLQAKIDDRIKYEAMGARPKVPDNTHASRKGNIHVDDEKQAKHRARSILANALPLTIPPTHPGSNLTHKTCGTPTVKSPKTLKSQNSLVNCMPITSTILTPVSTVTVINGTDPIKVASAQNQTNNSVDISTTTNNQEAQIPNGEAVSDKDTNAVSAISCNIAQDPLLTSAGPSRSSSPGFSITTFGLGADGKGVPAAFFFDMSSDQKVSVNQSSKFHLEVKPQLISKNPVTTVKSECDQQQDMSTTRRTEPDSLINSKWVQLTGNISETQYKSSVPWRTARAVSGNQLHLVRKSSQEEATTPSDPDKSNSTSATFVFKSVPTILDSEKPPNFVDDFVVNQNEILSHTTDPVTDNTNILLSPEELKSMASKNIALAIFSFENSGKSSTSCT